MASSDQQSFNKRLIETEAIIVAYAMSRLNTTFLEKFGHNSWRSAFAATGSSLGVSVASMKNLRDEFDPLHGFRKGWHQRPLRPNRQRVLLEFCDVSDEALLEVVRALLKRDDETRMQIASPIITTKVRVENVAERLKTGRIAEEFFLAHSKAICGIGTDRLIDKRLDAAGFDFAITGQSQIAIEVKGIKKHKGPILFTDLEWRTALSRKSDYWLIIVGNIASIPTGKLLDNPASRLSVSSIIRQAITVSWQATVSMSTAYSN